MYMFKKKKTEAANQNTVLNGNTKYIGSQSDMD